MKTECTKSYRSFQVLGKRTIVADFNGGTITSDGGVLLLREVEQRTTILQRFTRCFSDHRKALAGSTLNRLELTPANTDFKSPYKKIALNHESVDDLLADIFLESQTKIPEEIILDVDATDDPLHGNQEGKIKRPM